MQTREHTHCLVLKKTAREETYKVAEHVCFKHTALLESQNQLSGIGWQQSLQQGQAGGSELKTVKYPANR